VPSDELYALTAKTYDAMHELRMTIHYQSVGHGVGRASPPTLRPVPHAAIPLRQ
jgi:hypothetical protein